MSTRKFLVWNSLSSIQRIRSFQTAKGTAVQAQQGVCQLRIFREVFCFFGQSQVNDRFYRPKLEICFSSVVWIIRPIAPFSILALCPIISSVKGSVVQSRTVYYSSWNLAVVFSQVVYNDVTRWCCSSNVLFLIKRLESTFIFWEGCPKTGIYRAKILSLKNKT